MPLPADELLRELVKATEDAKVAKRQLHEEIQDGKTVVKHSKQMIEQAVAEQVAAVVDEVRTELRQTMTREMDALVRDWREKLGLT